MQSSTEFIADPTGHLLAVIDDPERAEGAMRVLSDAGFEEVRLYYGDTGAHALDPGGTEHGLADHLLRLIQQTVANKDNLAEYATAAEESRAVISLVAPDDEDRRASAVRVLEQCGAHTINYFGAAVVHTLRP